MYPNRAFQTGKTEIFSPIEMLMKIADFFSVSTDFLLGLDNRTSIIVDGLSTEELSHIRVIIDDLVAAKRRMGIEQNDDRPRE